MDTTSSVDKMFGALSDIQSLKSTGANYALNGALNAMQNNDYQGAIGQLRRVLAYTPGSVDAYNLMANAYAHLGKTDEMINAYKNVTRLNPASSAAHTNLGNAYLQVNNYADAEKEFQASAKIDPTSTTAPYTLGLLYVNTDRLQEAKEQFSKVVSLDRNDAHGYYGLGMAFNKQGKYADAITQLKQAVKIDPSFAQAQLELGKAYAGTGDTTDAQGQVSLLENLDTQLSSQLSNEIYHPKMLINLYTDNTLNIGLGPGTKLSDMDPSLATPGASKDFQMTFQFDSSMDAASVMNPLNWSITQAQGGRGGIYNNGVSLTPDSEILPSPMPSMVSYDPNQMQATITFSLNQNANGDGVIDPSHLVFKFSGTDVNGHKMDPKADELDGAGILPF